MSTKLPEHTKILLRRIAWAARKPMTQVLPAIVEAYAQTIDPGKVCERCKDKGSPSKFRGRTLCEFCPFNTRTFDDKSASILETLNHHFEREVTHMKPNQVSVLISKKVGKNFCSWSVSHGVTAELESEDHFMEAIAVLDSDLKGLVSRSLPTDFKAASPPKEIPAQLSPIPDAAFTTG
jgi:hypothetical protein